MQAGKQSGQTTNDRVTSTQRNSSRLVTLSLLLIVLAITGSGVALYQSARREVARNATKNLASVAQLKLSQIESWLDDGRHAIEQAGNSPSFMAAIDNWQNSGRRDAGPLRARLQQLATTGRFEEVSLFDSTGTLLLGTDPTHSPRRISVAPANNTTVLEDFHGVPHGDPEQVVVGLISPLRLQPEDKAGVWIHATLDHAHRLDPLLQLWPVSSSSAESLLVRREGENIVFINALRHRVNTPLAMRMALNTPELLAAQVIGGKVGGLEGVDYRNVPSLGYGLAVPDTPWFIVVKMDKDEAFASLNLLAGITASLLAALALVIAWAVRLRHRRLVAGLLLSERYEILVKYANDCIVITNTEHRIIDVNQRCLAIYGYDRDEMLAMTDDQLLPVESPARQTKVAPTGGEHSPRLFEALHRRKDGSIFPVEISEVVSEIDGELQTHRIVRDITERKNNEAHIAQLSRLSNALSAINHAIAHGTCIEEVFDVTCRACVEDGGFKLAWIGLADRENEQIRIANAWGEGVEFIDGQVIATQPGSVEANSPSAIAFREQRTCISAACKDDPALRIWHEQTAHKGIGAAVSLPISRDEIPMGVLTAYDDQANAFDAEARHLLGEIADGLSFAMHHFAELAAKRDAQQALREREAQLLKAEEIAHLGHWEIELKTGHSVWSPQMYRLFERDPVSGPASPEEIYSLYYTPDSVRLTQDSVRQAIIRGERIDIEQELRLPGERTAYHASIIVPIRDGNDRTIALHGTTQDITAHKQAETRLARMASRLAGTAREYEDLYQNAPCGYHSLDKDGVFQRINDTELNWLGYSRDEVIGKMKFSDLLPANRIPGFIKHFPRLMEAGEVRDLEQKLICRNGTILPVLINATVVRDEDGKFLMSRSTTYNMAERKKTEREKEDYARRLAILSRRLVSMQEEERRRLSASLHDHTSPNLAAIGLNLSIIDMSCNKNLLPDMVERLADIRALLEDTTASIRQISAELRPPLLDYAGLIPALEAYLYQFSKRTGTPARFDCDHFPMRPAPEVETLLFRVTQEALTNCAKHANATSVDVKLKRNAGNIVLDIKDNGNGFDPGGLGRNGGSIGLGMLNMRELTEFTGGRFQIDSHPGKGTAIRVEI